MQIKNKFKIILILVLCSFLFKLNVWADEFNITAKVITVDKENEIIVGTGSVKAQDSEGNIIYANKITYKKLTEYLLAEGSVKFIGVDGSIITTNKATYDKINELIVTYDDSELILNDSYKLQGKNISYYRTFYFYSYNLWWNLACTLFTSRIFISYYSFRGFNVCKFLYYGSNYFI